MTKATNSKIEIFIDANCASAPALKRKQLNPLTPIEQRLLDEAKDSNPMAWAQYDAVVVAFSGGKDSLAAVLHVIELGCPTEKIQLWHHEIDGREDAEAWMDWPSTPDYCQKVADELGLPLRYSWREGGFKREVLKDKERSAPVHFEQGDGTIGTAGGAGKENTRRKFPALSASLQTRWCSAMLKIDVADFALRNDPSFQDREERYLFITGERREESSNRAKYRESEFHRTACGRRNVVHWRAVIDWTEANVWGIIERHKITPHPAYLAGFGRCSCAFCIFGNPDQFATARDLLPEQFDAIVAVEEEIGFTMMNKSDLVTHADKGTSFAADKSDAVREACASTEYTMPVRDDNWTLPAGAFKEHGGPV